MTNRERAMAVLNYKNYDRMPIVHFGYWAETLQKWHEEGHVTKDECHYWGDNNEYDIAICKKLGFDFNWQPALALSTALKPPFPHKVIKDLGGGKKHVQNADGVILLTDDSISAAISAEVGHLLTDRASWEEHYKPRLMYIENRINKGWVSAYPSYLEDMEADVPYGVMIGSLFGYIRNWMGVEAVSFLYYEEEELYSEIVDTVGNLVFSVTKATMETAKNAGFTFDYVHFWEDICFNTGPLVVPSVFEEKVGPHYKRITDMVKSYGVDIISLDCDGLIDALLPIWLKNGVNTMFPIEVGTWDASIAPWREKYGKELRGVGGMNKNLFALDKPAIDAEIERLKNLTQLGGFIPCPDHRIPPDAKWELVQYYTDKMRNAYSA